MPQPRKQAFRCVYVHRACMCVHVCVRRASSSTEKLWEGAEKEDGRKKVGFKLVLKVEEETGKKESDPLSTIPLFPFIPMYPACSPKAKASVTLYCHQRTELSLLGASWPLGGRGQNPFALTASGASRPWPWTDGARAERVFILPRFCLLNAHLGSALFL